MACNMALWQGAMFLKISAGFSRKCLRHVHGLISTNNGALTSMSGVPGSKPNYQLQTPSTWINHNLSTDSRNPKPPKRPLNSYLLYALEKSPQLMAQQPDLMMRNVLKQIGQMWRDLPDSIKSEYTEKALANRQTYREDYKRYLENLTEEQKLSLKKAKDEKAKALTKTRLKRTLKDLQKPKKSIGRFAQYVRQEMKNRGTLPANIYFKELVVEWKSMSEAEKKPYTELAEEENRQYQIAMREWEDRMRADGHPEYLRGYRAPKLKKVKKIRLRGVTRSKPKPRKNKAAVKRVAAKKKKATAKKRALKAKNDTVMPKSIVKASKAGAKSPSKTIKMTSKGTQTEDTSWMREE